MEDYQRTFESVLREGTIGSSSIEKRRRGPESPELAMALDLEALCKEYMKLAKTDVMLRRFASPALQKAVWKASIALQELLDEIDT
jgi:hypothetical protein